MPINMQPSKALTIPEGATHWQHAYINPFIKVELQPCDDVESKMLQGDLERGFRLERCVHSLDYRNVCYRKVDGKWFTERRHIYFAEDNRWNEDFYCNDHRSKGFRVGNAIVLEPVRIPKGAKRINTVYGMGTLLGSDGGRVVIDLDENPFSYRPCWLFKRDLVA